MPKYKQTYTLFKRGKYYYYRTYTSDGIRTSAHTTGCTSRSAAKLYCDKLYKQGLLVAGSGKTFGEYAEGFFSANSVYAKDNNLSENSIRIYTTAINNTFMPILKNKYLRDITHSYLKKLRQDLLDSGFSSSSVGLKMKILRIVITSAYMDGLLERNPFDNLKGLQNVAKTRDAFTLEEVKLLFNSVPDSTKPAILLLALTGMRVAEMAAVSKEEVKIENGITYIHLESQMLNKELRPLKTKKPRDIPISTKLLPYIEERRPNYNQTVQVPSYKCIRKIQNAKERRLCLHSLRHFFISSAKSYGINHLKVEAIAGHSLKGIQEVYTTFHVGDLAEIIKWQEWAYQEITKAKV